MVVEEDALLGLLFCFLSFSFLSAEPKKKKEINVVVVEEDVPSELFFCFLLSELPGCSATAS